MGILSLPAKAANSGRKPSLGLALGSLARGAPLNPPTLESSPRPPSLAGSNNSAKSPKQSSFGEQAANNNSSRLNAICNPTLPSLGTPLLVYGHRRLC